MNQNHQESSILHLICGLPGSGKTTLSKKLEETLGAIRMCPDEWIKDIWPHELSEIEGGKYRDQIEQLQWKIGKKILVSGVDVIIEWGTWGKDEREKLRDEARQIGSKVKFYYLDVPVETLKKRVIARNMNLGKHDFFMSEDRLEDDLNKFMSLMQVPDENELKTYDFLG